jgi:hypothetical protein
MNRRCIFSGFLFKREHFILASIRDSNEGGLKRGSGVQGSVHLDKFAVLAVYNLPITASQRVSTWRCCTCFENHFGSTAIEFT